MKNFPIDLTLDDNIAIEPQQMQKQAKLVANEALLAHKQKRDLLVVSC